MLTASGLGKGFGGRTLFRDVTLELRSGRRVALIGSNGTGKTTLINILIGELEPDEGAVHRPADFTIGYLPQDLADDPEGTVLEEAIAGDERLQELRVELARLEAQLTSSSGDNEDLIEQFTSAQSRFEQLGGYSSEAEAHRVLAGLGFSADDAHRPLRELSGGWRMRAALARLLVARPDVLILDEPTNHLDVDSIAWLERLLADWPTALLFVSHDRDFIDAVAERVIELAGGTTTEYVGGFAEFVVAREERLAALEAAAAGQARKIAHTERFIERFRYKATKARQVQSRIKTLEKLERIEVPTREALKARFSFPEPQRSSRVVAELDNVTAGYDGGAVLHDVDLVVERGAKIALIGPNGAGKSTLVKLVTGELDAISGSVRLGNNVDVATFAQHQTEVLVESRTAHGELQATMGDLGARNLRTILGSFGFPGDAADRPIAELSGGERTRLALAKTMIHPVNLLVLDEPTNHLDLASCDLLEDALLAYPGSVILVTHDRHLIRSVAEHLVEVRDGRARFHLGVDESLLRPGEADSIASRRAPASVDGRRERKRDEAEARNRRHRATKDLRSELAQVEKRWERAEARVADAQAALADPAVYEDSERVTELAREHDRAKDEAAELAARWERLASRLERMTTD